AASLDGPIGQTFQLLADRLPNVEASVDLLKTGALSLRFSDGEDGYNAPTKSRDLVKLIRKSGPAAAADQMAAEFQSLDASRTHVLRAINRAAARRGWRHQSFAMPFFGVESTTFLG